MSYGYPPQQPGPQPGPQPGQQPGQPPQQPPQWGQQPPPPYQQWPQQGAGWGAPPPRKSNTGLIVTLSVLGGLVLLGGCGALVAVTVSHAPKPRTLPTTEAPQDAPGKDAPSEEPAVEGKSPEADVKLTECAVDSLTTWPAADVEIVNHGDSKATYVVNVEFVDGSGTRLGEGLAATDSLAVGQKAKEKAQGLVKVPGKVRCKVTKVTRYPSN